VLAALRVAYGDSADRPCVIHTPACPPPPWGVDLERLLRERLDLAVEPVDWQQFHLNQPSSESDAFVTAEMIANLPRAEKRKEFAP
jgi:hypothetical protein